MAYDKGSMARMGAVPFSAGISKSNFAYATADTRATVLAANYFNTDFRRFDQGDMIDVVYGLGGTVGRMCLTVTSAKGAAVVTVAALGAVTDNTGGQTNQALSANLARQTVMIPLQLADIAAGSFKVALPFAFTVLNALFRTAKPASTAAKAATLTVAINGVNVTGGVMNITSANQATQGGSVAASAITGANTGTAGQTLEVAASAVTAFVEGDGWVEVTVRNDDLNNAIAAMNAA